jgi:ubiquinone/menaquinone biosynthesis C-methylase UbiE
MNDQLKGVVKERYGQIARESKTQNQSSCCGSASCCSTTEYAVFNDNYEAVEGYNPDADLALGCGLPTEFAGIKPGHAVLDLGSGAGNDCFVARSLVGETGQVTGLDFTDEMLELARRNNQKLGYANIEFVKGDIEEMPLPSNTFDVVVSNCVLNLVPDKDIAFKQIMRVLKPGAHFCVSDVVVKGELPQRIRTDAELYAGCVSGALEMGAYLDVIKNAGFISTAVHKQKPILIPDQILQNYLNPSEFQQMKEGEIGLFSITVTAYKPS